MLGGRLGKIRTMGEGRKEGRMFYTNTTTAALLQTRDLHQNAGSAVCLVFQILKIDPLRSDLADLGCLQLVAA